MAAVHESGNSVVVDVNPDVVQENSDNQLGDAGNQTNSMALEIEEDSNYQVGDASGSQPSSQTEDVNSIEAEEDAGNQLNSIDNTLYNKATKGDFHAFEQIDADSLTQLATRVDKNTILHICITAATPYYGKKTVRNTEQNESVVFVKKALAKCKQLLWQTNEKGETILHIPARYGHHDIVQVLLTEDKEAHCNGQADNRPLLLGMKNKVGDTALHEAVRYSHLRVVKKLINEDRNYKYGQNSDGETPLYIAAEKGARKIVHKILDKCKSLAYQGPDERTALHAAALCFDEEVVELLLGKLKELTRKVDKLGWTPLHYAARCGYLPIVKVLLKEGKDAAYIADRKQKKTALHVAARESKADVVKEFMLACPDCFEQVDKNGRNVLHFAVETNNRGQQKILRLVLQNECFSNLINAKDNLGNTPLHHAAVFHSSATFLVFHPKLNAQVFNEKNLSPLDIVSTQSDPTWNSIWTSRFLAMVDNRCNLRITDEDEGKERGEIKHQDGINKDELDLETKHNRKKDFMTSLMTSQKFLRDFDVVVATLIATVTFAAGLTMPGGYISNNGSDQGTAALIRKPAFEVFVLSDTIAFTFSSAVVLIGLWMRNYTTLAAKLRPEVFLLGTRFDTDMFSIGTAFAMIAMVIAFLSGTCAVLAPYPHLVTALGTFSACVFVFLIYCRVLLIKSIFWWVTSRISLQYRRRLMYEDRKIMFSWEARHVTSLFRQQ